MAMLRMDQTDDTLGVSSHIWEVSVCRCFCIRMQRDQNSVATFTRISVLRDFSIPFHLPSVKFTLN